MATSSISPAQLQALFREVILLDEERMATRLDEIERDAPSLGAELRTLVEAHRRSGIVLEELDRVFPTTCDDASNPTDPLIGATVSHYRVRQRIGAGGMGVVYEAHDTTLDRAVVLKFLWPDGTHSPANHERLIREARAASALDHPNIGTIHEVGRAPDGRPFLVMAQYGGGTLRGRMADGRLPVREATELAAQIASGLAAAHRAGIVHRDVKPSNVLLTENGTAKIVDFGLARPVDSGPTASGSLMGTPAYMSPEQVSGARVDRRSDIWSLGVMLYEMLSGALPFRGGDPNATMWSVLNGTPAPLADLRPDVPPAVDHVVGTCLARDPAARYQHADEVVAALSATHLGPAAAPWPARLKRVLRRRLRVAWTGPVLLSIAALVVAAVVVNRRSPAPLLPMSQFEITLPPGRALATGGWGPSLATASDGSAIVYAAVENGVSHLYLKPRNATEARLVQGTEGALLPFLSRDGREIGFYAKGALRTVSSRGGAAALRLAWSNPVLGAAWTADGSMLFASCLQGIERLAPGQPDAERITAIGIADPRQQDRDHEFPQLLPGGEWVLLTAADALGQRRIVVHSLRTNEEHTVIDPGTAGRYLPTGHLVYAVDGRLMAAPFDLDERKLTSRPVTVLEGVLMEEALGVAHYGVSDEGTLTYVPGGVVRNAGATMVLAGGERPEETVPWPPGDGLWRISPDGSRILVARSFIQGAKLDLWVYDRAHGTQMQLTDDHGDEFWATWTPDGRHVVFNSNREGGALNLYTIPSDGSAPPTRIGRSDHHQVPYSVSPDGALVAYTAVDTNSMSEMDIWTAALTGDHEARPFLTTSAREIHPAFSPDGHWLAYASDASGRFEVYVKPFPGPGSTLQISSTGGAQPLWARDGRTVFYRSGPRLYAVPVRPGAPFTIGSARLVLEGPFNNGSAIFNRQYDLAPDGRFLLVRLTEPPPAPTRYRVVVNWFSELERLVPIPRR